VLIVTTFEKGSIDRQKTEADSLVFSNGVLTFHDENGSVIEKRDISDSKGFIISLCNVKERKL